jgi:tetratricopeptide (TPR) repeat protein
MSKGYVYILVDPSLPDNLFKIEKNTQLPPKSDKKSFARENLPFVGYDIAVSDYQKAEALIRDALNPYRDETYPDYYNLPLSKAISLFKDIAEQMDKIDHFRQAIEIDPDNASFYNNLGCSYDRINNLTAAIDAYKKAVSLEPENALYHNNLGCNYGKLGLFRKAIDSFRTSISLKPDFVKAYFDLGYSYVQLGYYKEAAETFEKAIRINPNIAQIHYALGHAYNNLGLSEKSNASFQNAVRINPKHAKAIYSLALNALHSGDKKTALSQCRVLKEIDDARAKELFRKIYRYVEKKPE